MVWFIVILALLLVTSAFFSAAETGMMSLNRYRLRHRALAGDKTAQRVFGLFKNAPIVY